MRLPAAPNLPLRGAVIGKWGAGYPARGVLRRGFPVMVASGLKRRDQKV